MGNYVEIPYKTHFYEPLYIQVGRNEANGWQM